MGPGSGSLLCRGSGQPRRRDGERWGSCPGRDVLCPAELWVSLEEHQDALELIMSKYRKQMLQLLEGRKREDAEPVLKAHQANSGVRWDGDRRVLETACPSLTVMQSLFTFL